MTTTALITGATSGIGAEFARQFAARGCDLVLVARSAEALERSAEELRRTARVQVETLAADLLAPDGRDRVLERIRAGGDPGAGAARVDVLVNNAGYGLSAPFADNALDDEMDHLRIHVEIPLALAHAALQVMRRHGEGTIINVASVAGFVPRGSYGAAKAAMISFSRWAHVAYAGDGVRVTALCPGFVHTGFHRRMGVDDGGVPRLLWLDAPFVVREALKDTAAGKAVSIPGLRYRALVALARVLPSSVVTRVAGMGR